MIDGHLIRLWSWHDDHVVTTCGSGFTADAAGRPASGSAVTVDITADGSGTSVLAALKAIGLEHGTAFGKMVSGKLPIDSIDELAQAARRSFGHGGLFDNLRRLGNIAGRCGDAD